MAVKPVPIGEEPVPTVDPIWYAVRRDAEAIVRNEPDIATLIYANVLNHDRLEDAIVHRIAERLNHPDVAGDLVRQAYREALADEPDLGSAMRADLAAVFDRDPACNRYIEPVLYFKGFHALETHRLANWLWRQNRRDFAYYLQSRASIVFQVDIHPAVPIGRGVFIDHATGVVVGSTAVIEDDVSILQDVTLGGTGKEKGDRHPKVRSGVLIGAGAKILGNIEVGAGSRVAAGSVVLHPVPPHSTVAGVPAKLIGHVHEPNPARSMDHRIDDSEVHDSD